MSRMRGVVNSFVWPMHAGSHALAAGRPRLLAFAAFAHENACYIAPCLSEISRLGKWLRAGGSSVLRRCDGRGKAFKSPALQPNPGHALPTQWAHAAVLEWHHRAVAQGGAVQQSRHAGDVPRSGPQAFA